MLAFVSQVSAAPPQPDHLIVVILENHSFRQIADNPDARFIRDIAKDGALFTNAYAITHPSQPNYFALFSGSTHDIRDDLSHDLDKPTLAGALRHAHKSFIGYSERGSPRQHNPWESFAESRNSGEDFDEFPDDFAALPTVAFVIPNNNNDMHDGSVRRSDKWLDENLGDYADWCKKHNSMLIITFDEDDDRSYNQIATIFYGAHVAPARYDQRIDHYSVLRAIEEMYGLPLLGKSAGARPIGDIWQK